MTKLAWTIAAVLALAGVLWWSSGGRRGSPVERGRPMPAPGLPAAEQSSPRIPVPASARERVEPAPVTSVDEGDSSATTTRSPDLDRFLGGIVLGTDGEPRDVDVIAYDTHGLPTPDYRARRKKDDPDRGRFRIDLRGDAGPYRVVATDRDGAFAVLEEVSEGRDDLVLRLDPGGSIPGRVIDEHGLPVRSFSVRGLRVPFLYGRTLRASGRDGVFSLTGFDQGTWELRVEARDLLQLEDVEVEFPAPGPVVVRMTRAVTLSGRVVNASGARLPERSVRASSGSATVQLLTDAEGTFLLEDRLPGEWTLSLEDEDGAVCEPVVRTLAAGEVVRDVVLVAGPAATLRGTVADLAGLPSAGVGVVVHDALGRRWQTTSDEGGRFELTDLVPGLARVDARVDGGRAQLEERLVPGGIHEIVLEPPRGTRVQVHGSVTIDGRPAATVTGVVSVHESGSGDLGATELASARVVEGRYEVWVAQPGTYVLRLTRPCHSLWTIEIPAGEEFVHDIALETGRVRGRVVGADGAPRGRVAVQALAMERGPGESHGAMALTDHDGGFELRVVAGANEIRVLEPGVGPATRRVEVAAGGVVGGVELVVE